MTGFSLNYHGYTISGRANENPVQYQSPEWPDDPRIVKAPSLETAKRWIREEIKRKARFPDGRRGYLVKSWFATTKSTVWRITNPDMQDLVQPWFSTSAEAREFAETQGWLLLEHFNY